MLGLCTSTAPTPSCLSPRQFFKMRCHVVFDQVAVTGDLANEIGLVAPGIEIAMSDLAIIVGPYRVVALTDVDHHVHVFGKPLNGHVDDLDSRADFAFAGGRKIGFINLNVLASGSGELFKVLMQQFAEIRHHLLRIAIVLVVSHCREKMRASHGDLHRLSGEGRYILKFCDEAKIDGIRESDPCKWRLDERRADRAA